MKALSVCVLSIALVISCFAEGSLTNTWTTLGNPTKVDVAWYSSTNGIVGAIFDQYIRGEIAQVILVSTSVAAATYSVTMTNTVGIDLLGGRCTSVPSNSTFTVCPALAMSDGGTTNNLARRAWNDLPTLRITGLGESCSGHIYVYIK